MNIVTSAYDWKEIKKTLPKESIGLVPTMGNLHEGHLSLCKRACDENDIAVVTIFVNPGQFNQYEDYQAYPRTLEKDIEMLMPYSVDYLLLPKIEDMYFFDNAIEISEKQLSKQLEGAFRPGHFDSMMTVVLKLINLTSATRAYFGEKDYQQLSLIKKMAQYLFLPTTIVGCETIRAADGLALSSRNARLDVESRKKAALFAHILKNTSQPETAKAELIKNDIAVDYVVDQWDRRLGAVWINGVRLIDNVALSEVEALGEHTCKLQF